MYVFILFTACILFVLPTASQYTFAEESHVVWINQNDSLPGCEKSENCFSHYKLTIATGDNITWKNPSGIAHTVTSGQLDLGGADGYFDSGLINDGETFSFDFKKLGKHPYYCLVHPWMTGIIEVVSDDSKSTNGEDCFDLSSFFTESIKTKPFFEDFERYCPAEKNSIDENFSYTVWQHKEPETKRYGITHDVDKGKGLTALLQTQRVLQGDKHDIGAITEGQLKVGSFSSEMRYFSTDVYPQKLQGDGGQINSGALAFIKVIFHRDNGIQESIAIIPGQVGRVIEVRNEAGIKHMSINLKNSHNNQYTWDRLQYDVKDLYETNDFGDFSDVTHWSLFIGGQSYTENINNWNGWGISIDNLAVFDGNSYQFIPTPKEQLRLGFEPQDILCREGKTAVYRFSDSMPICINDTNVDSIWDLNYGIPKNPFITPHVEMQIQEDKEYFTDMLVSYENSTDTVMTSSTVDDVLLHLDGQRQKLDFLLKHDPAISNFHKSQGTGIPFMAPNSAQRAPLADAEPGVWSSDERRSGNLGESGSRSFVPPMDDYSTTNIHVIGVDEADFVKNDAEKIFVINTNGDISATNAQLDKHDTLSFTPDKPDSLFLYDDKIITISASEDKTRISINESTSPRTALHTLQMDTQYKHARMIGDVLYLISESPINSNTTQPTIIDTKSDKILSKADFTFFESTVEHEKLNTVTAIDITNLEANSESFVIGQSDTIYVSQDSIYYTNSKSTKSLILSNVDFGLIIEHLIDRLDTYHMSEIYRLEQQQQQQQINHTDTDTIKDQMIQYLLNNVEPDIPTLTAIFDPNASGKKIPFGSIIHKISIDQTNIEYSATGKVPGTIPNEFAVDQDKEYLRVATSSSGISGQLQSNVYVLDESLNIVGLLEGIAPGETLHSTRFSGDWLYLVTFRQVDPFFVVDVSGTQPKILGELKIPGFSQYLQNYDEDHIVGIGRATTTNEWGGAALGGVKISMFDVTDFENPVETSNITIGDAGTSTLSTVEHKAVLIDKKKGLITVPVVFGQKLIFYAYTVDEDFNLEEHSQIPHEMDANHPDRIRSFYIGDALYTVTPKLIKANSILQQDYTIQKLVIAEE